LDKYDKNDLVKVFRNEETSFQFSEFNKSYQDFKTKCSVNNGRFVEEGFLEPKHWEVLFRTFTRGELKDLAGEHQIIPTDLWSAQQLRPAATRQEYLDSLNWLMLLTMLIGIAILVIILVPIQSCRY